MNYLIVFLLSLTSSWTMHERDIAGPLELRKNFPEFDFFRPDQVQTEKIIENKLIVKQFLKKGHQLIPLELMPFRINGQHLNTDGIACNPLQNLKAYYIIDSPFFKILNKKNYEAIFSAQCGQKVKLIYEFDSFAGEVMTIWNTAQKAVEKMRSHGLIQLWKYQVPIQFPSRGDFYDGKSVHITKGYQWDVVAHEIGHAIYHQAGVGVSGGGVHYIDQCYTHALALSEGWASFFAGWLMLDLHDSDAKFEFMVPRRAPIQIENIPSDVCKGSTNEWRVSAFFWDLIDFAEDGESLAEKFTNILTFSVNKRFKSADHFKEEYKKQIKNPELIESIWDLNFL